MPRRKYPARRRVVRQRKLNNRQKTQVKRLIGRRIESKVNDSNVLQTVDASGTNIQRLAMPTVGDAYNERSGDVITLEKLQWRLNAVAGDTTNTLRMIIFRWLNDSQVSTPTVSDILEANNSLAFVDYQSDQQKMQVLFDRTYALSTQGVPNRIITGSLYGRKLGRKKLTFNQGLTTGVDQIFVYFQSDSVAITHPGVAGYFRVTYSDA